MNLDTIEGLNENEIEYLFEDTVLLSCGCSCREEISGNMVWSADIGVGVFCGRASSYSSYWDNYCRSICNGKGIGSCDRLYVGYYDGYYDRGIVWFCR